MAKSAKNEFKLFLLVIFTIFWPLNCASHKPEIKQIPKEQKFLFEFSYLGFAWGFKHYGFYIDRHGRVYSFKYSKLEYWQPKESDRFSEAELLEKYSHNPKLLCELGQSELIEKYSLIDSAAIGPLTERSHPVIDAGIKQYIAFQYDLKSEKYIAVLLKMELGYTQENMSSSAAVLLKWLQQVCN